MNDVSPKIIDRIRKLLTMAQDERGNDNERETALRQAHSLLTTHGLSLLEINEKERDVEDPRIAHENPGWSMNWTHFIRNDIARLFMCRYIRGGKINGTKQTHWFVGRESNAITAEYMSTYVVENILKEGRKLYKHNLSAGTRSFAQGCSVTLTHRINDMIRAKAEEVGSGTGSSFPGTQMVLYHLAKQEAEANEEFLSDWNLRRTKMRSGRLSPDAYYQGKEHAKSINLNVQMAKPTEQGRLS